MIFKVIITHIHSIIRKTDNKTIANDLKVLTNILSTDWWPRPPIPLTTLIDRRRVNIARMWCNMLSIVVIVLLSLFCLRAMRSLERIVALLPRCSSVCLYVWEGRALWSYGAFCRGFKFGWIARCSGHPHTKACPPTPSRLFPALPGRDVGHGCAK